MKSILLTLLISFSLKAQTVYQIGVEDIPYLPFYETKNGQYQGYAKELMDAFAKDEGIKFEYVSLPVKRLFKNYLSEKSNLDFKFPDNSYWAQELKKGINIQYSKGIVSFTDGLMTSVDNTKDFKLNKLGVVRGFTAWDYLDQIKKKEIELVESNSLESVLKLALLKRVDAVYVNRDVAEYFLDNNLKEKGKLVFRKESPHTNSSYTISSIKHPEVLAKFDAWLIKNQKLHEDLLKKWGLNK